MYANLYIHIQNQIKKHRFIIKSTTRQQQEAAQCLPWQHLISSKLDSSKRNSYIHFTHSYIEVTFGFSHTKYDKLHEQKMRSSCTKSFKRNRSLRSIESLLCFRLVVICIYLVVGVVYPLCCITII